MKYLARFLFSAFVLFACAARGYAADIEHHWDDNGDGGYITITGDIEKGDADKFRKLAAGTKADTVFLSSQGGSLSEAFEIGRIITVSNYTTIVIDGDWCSSACALIWIAGGKRFAQPRARIGFHAGYTVDNGKPITSGMANALIGRYLTQLNLPAEAIVFATSATPEKMAWLDTAHPGREGISYSILPSSIASVEESKVPPKINITPVAISKTKPSDISGKTFGKWKIHAESNFYGAITLGANGKGVLAYFCPAGKSCRFAARIEMSCVPGDQYSMKYRVEGYAEKPMEVTCDTDGKTLFINNSETFRRDVDQEIGVILLTENDKGVPRSIRFNLVGLDQAIDELSKAGYIVNAKE